MKLDITASPSEFRQQLSELLAGDSDIADREIGDLLKSARHGLKLKNKRSQPRQLIFTRLLIKSVDKIHQRGLPVTIERVAFGLFEFKFDKDCYRIIEEICFDDKKGELCVIWNHPKSGIEKVTSFSAIAKVLTRAGIKYESYMNEGIDEGLYRLSDELNQYLQLSVPLVN